jgi:hypothetical protein
MNKIINTKWSFKDWISASVQPFLILGSMLLVANMTVADSIYKELFNAVMIVLPIPLCILAERIWTKKRLVT